MNRATIAIAVWAAVVGLRWHALTHTCYLHVKDLVKGDQAAAYKALRRQNRRRAGRDTGLHQATLIKVANPSRHVILLPRPLFFLLPIRVFLRGAVIRWTPMVGYPTVGWLEELTDAVAHFLGTDPDELGRSHFKPRRKHVHVVRAGAPAIPGGLPYDAFPTETPMPSSEPSGEWRDVG